MKKPKCEICGKRATKALGIAGRPHRLFLCGRCARELAAGIRDEGGVVQRGGECRTATPPKLLDRLADDVAIRSVVQKQKIDLLFLWLYPHEDWLAAVECGMTDRPSYDDYRDAVLSAAESIEAAGAMCYIITTKVRDFVAALGDRPNTPENRSIVINEIGLRELQAAR